MSLGHDLAGAQARMDANARLMILKLLAEQADGRLNAIMLRSLLEMNWAVRRSPEWLETQLYRLAELGAAEVTAGAVPIARILPAGTDHLEERGVIAGVTRPRDFR